MLEIKDSSFAARKRYSTNIVLKAQDPGARMLTTEEKAYRTSALVDAVGTAFRQKPDAKAVVVFAYSSPEAATAGPFDIARAFASTDALGWGDKSDVFGPGRSTDGPRKVVLTFRPGPDDRGGDQFAEATRP